MDQRQGSVEVAGGVSGSSVRVMPSSCSTRRRRDAAKSDRGARGVTGRRRVSKASGRSVLAVSLAVSPAIGAPGAHQQAFGSVDRAPDGLGHLSDGKSIHVAESERGAVPLKPPSTSCERMASRWASQGSSVSASAVAVSAASRSSRLRRLQ